MMRKFLSRLHKDERGEELLTMFLVLAFLAVPLLIVLIGFAQDIIALLDDAVNRLRPGR